MSRAREHSVTVLMRSHIHSELCNNEKLTLNVSLKRFNCVNVLDLFIVSKPKFVPFAINLSYNNFKFGKNNLKPYLSRDNLFTHVSRHTF